MPKLYFMIRKNLLIPIAIWLVFTGLYFTVSTISDSDAFTRPVWDIQHYFNISETGYEVYPCTPYDYPPGEVCGNVGWFPMWPLVLKVFRPVLGGDTQTASMILTLIMTLISFVLLYGFVESKYNRNFAITTVAALAFSPPGFYLLTGFPYALFLLLFMLYLDVFYNAGGYLKINRLALYGLAMSLTYPTGILFAVIPLIGGLIKYDNGGTWGIYIKWKSILIGVFPFILGLILLWLYFYFMFDNFFVQLDFQARYQRTWSFPLTVIYNSLTQNPFSSPENLVIIWFSLALLLFAPYKVKPELWIMAIFLFLFSPATGTTMSLYRHYLAIFPIYMIIGTSSRPIWMKSGFIALGLLFALWKMFPAFLDFKLI